MIIWKCPKCEDIWISGKGDKEDLKDFTKRHIRSKCRKSIEGDLEE